MFLVIFAAVSGAALTLILRGGTPVVPSSLRAAPAFVLGLLALVAAEWLPIPGRPGVYIVGTVLVVAALAQNLHFNGAFVTAVGLALTGFVVLINGYLPLGLDAANTKDLNESGLRKIQVEDTRLGALGDIVPLPVGPWAVSFGDLIAAAGAFILVRSLLLQETEADDGVSADEFLAAFLEVDGHSGTRAQGDDQIDLTKRRTIDLRVPEPPPRVTSKRIPPPPIESDRF